MASFTSAGGGGIPISISLEGPSSPSLVNLDMALASTEYSYTLPVGVKRFLLQPRIPATLQLAYISGDSGVTYLTVPKGTYYAEEGIIYTSSITIYIQSSVAGQTLEILTWT